MLFLLYHLPLDNRSTDIKNFRVCVCVAHMEVSNKNMGKRRLLIYQTTKVAAADVILLARKQNHENHLYQSARWQPIMMILKRISMKSAIAGPQGVTR